MKNKQTNLIMLCVMIAAVVGIVFFAKAIPEKPPEPTYTSYNPVTEVSQERLNEWRNLAWKTAKQNEERRIRIETLERQIKETEANNARLHTKLNKLNVSRAVKRVPAKTTIGFSQEVEGVIVKVAGEFGWSEYIYELKYIIKYESGGTVGAINKTSSARGLGQLLKMNYHLMPNGAKSIGNAYEEMVGMCNYIKGRYNNPHKAYIFKKNNGWY